MTVRRLIGAASAVGVLTAASLLGFTGLAAAENHEQGEQQEAEWVTLSASGSGADVADDAGEEGTDLTASISLATDGRMTITIIITGNEEDITSAHIHRGAVGENGDEVVELDADAINDGTAAEVELEPDLTERIINNPGNWYIDAHSESFEEPAGVARAQLVGEEDAEEPDIIDTGDGGQFAAQQQAAAELDAGAVAGGALLLAAAAGGAYALRRRAGHDNV